MSAGGSGGTPSAPASKRLDRLLTTAVALGMGGAGLAHLLQSGLSRGLFAAALLLLAVRLFRNARLAWAGRLSWGRLVLPGLLLLEGLAALARPGPGALLVKGITLAMLELGLLLLAWRSWRSSREGVGNLPEARLAGRLQTFLGPTAARLVALELVVLGGAVQALAGRSTAPGAGCFSYHRNSVLGSMLLALPVMAVGDLLLLDLLLRHAPPWVRWSVHGLDLYGLLWVLGLWQSMRNRPHRLTHDELWLHRGVLGHLRIPRSALGRLQEVPVFDAPEARRAFLGEAANLAVSGPPELVLDLREPLQPSGFFGPGAVRARVRFAVDDAEAFRRALGA